MFVEFAESPAFAELQEVERRFDYLIALRRAEVRCVGWILGELLIPQTQT